ncbi:MAG TPA: DUF6152 family protein [Bryobacteraceae bacterium]|nr:DUF6152 family protein [Bryobacteraceae bacterium]
MGNRSAIFVLGMLPLAPPLPAHHSFGAEYDANQPITLTGVITKIDWMNPHSYFYMDVTDDKGNVANWKFEGYPPNVLYRTGWKRDVTIKQGDKITVFAWRARDGTNWAHARQVTLQDGKKLFFGPPAGTGDGGARPVVDAQ